MRKEIQTVWAPGEPRPAPQLPGKRRGLGMMSLDLRLRYGGWATQPPLWDQMGGPGHRLSSSRLTPSLTDGAKGSSGAES